MRFSLFKQRFETLGSSWNSSNISSSSFNQFKGIPIYRRLWNWKMCKHRMIPTFIHLQLIHPCVIQPSICQSLLWHPHVNNIVKENSHVHFSSSVFRRGDAETVTLHIQHYNVHSIRDSFLVWYVLSFFWFDFELKDFRKKAPITIRNISNLAVAHANNIHSGT